MKLFFRTFGEGQPLLILHGVFGSSDNWVTIAKKLAERYKIYIVDARNHGLSGHDDTFNLEVMSEDLRELMDTESIHQPILVGHSMGGKVAMTFAAKFPDKVAKLVVVDIGPKEYPVHHTKIFEALFALDLSSLNSRNDADAMLTKQIADIATRQFLLKNLYRKADNSFGWRFNVDVLHRNIIQIGLGQWNNPPFRKPTLFIKGEKSEYILDKDWAAILTLFPDATLAVISGAGHWVHADNPQEFIHCLEEFIGNRD